MRKTKNTKAVHYGKRVFGINEEITNDTRITNLNNHDLIIGTSGSGKSGSYVVPAIQNVDGSLVVSDTKGQLERRFRKELEAKGYKVVCLDFVDPLRSCGYNPLLYIRRLHDGSIREQDILTLAHLICPDALQDREPIWNMNATDYVAFLIAFCMENEEIGDPNLVKLADIRRLISRDGLDIELMVWMEEHPDSFATKKYQEVALNKSADKMWASIEGFVNAHLTLFNVKEMENIFARKDNNFDIASLGKEKTVLFINQSDTDRAFDKVINILHTQIFQVLCSQADANKDGRLDIPVRIILDDFASSARIPDFDKTISVIRSRDISVSIIIQSMSQLEHMYDKQGASTIIDNCDTILFMGSNNKDTAEYIAYRAMRSQESILTMPRDSAYLIRSGEKARLIKKIPPYSTLKEPPISDESEVMS